MSVDLWFEWEDSDVENEARRWLKDRRDRFERLQGEWKEINR